MKKILIRSCADCPYCKAESILHSENINRIHKIVHKCGINGLDIENEVAKRKILQFCPLDDNI